MHAVGQIPDSPPRMSRFELVPFAVLLFIVFLHTQPILAGKADPFTASFKDYEPWKSQMTQAELERNQGIDDAVSQSYAWTVYAHECLRRGDFPLWNTRIFSGTPFVANRHTALFNPLLLVPLLFVPPIPALTFYYMIHYLIGGWFMYLFLKSLRLRRWVALFGAIAYMLQGAYIPWSELIIADLAYFPAILYYVERACSRRDRAGIVGFIVSFALLAVTGYPQNIVFMLYLVIFWLLFTKGPGIGAAVKRLAGLIAMLVPALLIGAMQHLPMLEFYRLSMRSYQEFQSGFEMSSRPENFSVYMAVLTMFFPTVFGDCQSTTAGVLPVSIMAMLNYAFAGVITAFASLFFPIVWRNRYARFFTVIWLVGLVIVLSNPVYQLAVRFLPGFRMSQLKPYFVVETSMIMVAAFVIDNVVGRIKIDRPLVRKLNIAFVLSIAALIGLCVVWLQVRLAPSFTPPEVLPPTGAIAGGTAVLAGVLTLGYLYSRGLGYRWLASGVILLELLNLVPYHLHFVSLVAKNRAVFETPSIRFLEDRMASDGPLRIYRDRHKVLRPNSPVIFGLDDMGGFDSLVSSTYANYFRFIDPAMVRDSRYIEIPGDPSVYGEPFWDFLGVRYLVSTTPMSALPSNWQPAWQGEVFVYENTSWLPRWFFVPKIVPVGTMEDGYEASRKIDPAREAVVEGIREDEAPASLVEGAEPNGDVSRGEVRVALYEADEARLAARCDRDSFLVFSDSWFPGWRAWVDGREVKVYRTDGVVKGIVVPGGEHEVRFEYDPISYRIGLVLVFLGIVLVITVVRPIRRLLG
jgi:hypothetical protein